MKRLSLFLFASLLIHLIVYTVLNWMPPQQPASKDIIEVTLSSDKDSKKLESAEKLRQIVDQDDKALNKEIPDKDYFLSKNNQTVKKSTVAANKGDFQNSKSSVSAPMPVPAPMPAPVPKASPTPTDQPQKINEKFDPLTDTVQRFKSQRFERMSGSTASSPAAVSQSPDYLKDTQLGVETILSTKEFKYYTYFNRIRKQLSQHWEPKVKDKLTKMFRQGRTIASEQDRITKLLIVLSADGVLVKVQMVSDSGVRDLDEAAVEAFRSAAPFPNPPKGIIDPDGTVKIRWDFILES